MKLMKYVFVLAIAFCAITSISNAQSFVGGGSSALFLELGQAAVVTVGNAHLTGATPNYCIYSHKSSGLTGTVNAQDNRLGPAATTESGDFWIVWGPTISGGVSQGCGTPDLASPFYMYTNLDSVLGNRGYFEVDPGNGTGCAAGAGYCQILSLAAADLVCPGAGCPNDLLNVNTPAAPFTNMANNAPPPATVISAIHNSHWSWAGTDIRPEDAKFATFRVLAPCNAFINRQPFDQILRQVQGLGYSAGNTIGDDFSAGKLFHVKDFNISGNDPVTNNPVPGFTTSTVGAQPIIIAVGPNPSPSGLGIAQATDIPSFVAANFFDGTLVRANDLVGPSAPFAVTALIREPLSGTYNTFEFGAINNSQFHVSMDIGNCSGGTPPTLHIVSGNGVGLEGGTVQGFRRRVIGTGQMVSTLQASVEGGGNQPSKTQIGYFFWSAANVAGLTKVKYLTYNGVDPIQNSYTNGTLPSSGGPGDPCSGSITTCPAGLITFKNLNNGDYALWSALRVISASPTPGAITSLIAGAQTLNSSQTDFVPLSSLKAWRSHFLMTAINVNTGANGPTINPATPGDLCNPGGGPALPEQGGDVGGSIILKQANADFCSDYNNNTGLVSKTE